MIAARAEAFASARTLVAAGDFPGAEDALASAVAAEADSAAWHAAVGNMLLTLLPVIQREGQAKAVAFLGARAVQHFARADALAEKPAQKAGARHLAGMVCERFLGDREGAKAWYRAAAVADRRITKSAEALARLEAGERAAQARVTARKN